MIMPTCDAQCYVWSLHGMVARCSCVVDNYFDWWVQWIGVRVVCRVSSRLLSLHLYTTMHAWNVKLMNRTIILLVMTAVYNHCWNLITASVRLHFAFEFFYFAVHAFSAPWGSGMRLTACLIQVSESIVDQKNRSAMTILHPVGNVIDMRWNSLQIVMNVWHALLEVTCKPQ